MTCKHCGKTIPDKEVRSYLGRLMGSVTGPTKARDSDKMREAGRKRWGKVRVDESKAA